MMDRPNAHSHAVVASDPFPSASQGHKITLPTRFRQTIAALAGALGTSAGVLGIVLFVALLSGCQRSTPANANDHAATASPTATASPAAATGVTIDTDAQTDVNALADGEAIADEDANTGGDASTDADVGVNSADAGEQSTSSKPIQQEETTTVAASTSDTNTADQQEQADAPSERPETAQPDTGVTPASMRVRPRVSLRADGVLDLTFDEFEFAIEKDADFDRSMLNDKIESFNGKEILIRGFILDSSVFSLKNIKQFVLVRDNQQCCFGPGAYLFHNMQVEMVEGETANFSIRPVTVQGKFQIKPWIGPDGKCYSVYHVTAKSVK